MKMMVNALSVTNPSGAQVLLGHLMQISAAVGQHIEIVLLVRSEQRQTFAALNDRVSWRLAPGYTRHWIGRSWWERVHLRSFAYNEQIHVYFTPSGFAASGLPLRQIILCQNPWAFVRAARRRRDGFKAWLQRQVYAQAMKTADAMVFNSEFMQEQYHRQAGVKERLGIIAYQAPDSATLERAKVLPLADRVPGQIVCVSVMGRHKNVETVLSALKQVQSKELINDVRLHLVGSWPDRGYRRKIGRIISALGLSEQVEIHGFVNRKRLEQFYAESLCFILMSRCESFGIPAIEAQAFGTPVISSNVCAIPEICGEGGLFFDPADVAGVAHALERILTDPAYWNDYSMRARQNATRFHWQQVSRPVVDLVASYAKNPTATERKSL